MKFVFVVILILILIAVWIFFQPGGFLVINDPDKSDAIVMLAGDAVDTRYWRGLELLRAGYGQHLVVDVTPGVIYGRSIADLARDFIARTAGSNLSQVSVCVVEGDSTKDEAPQVEKCLERLQPPPQHSVLLVTDDYHTRRALSIFSNRLPQYHWTAAAAHNQFLFGQPWWKNREWAKTYLTEWEKLLWWELHDRWRN